MPMTGMSPEIRSPGPRIDSPLPTPNWSRPRSMLGGMASASPAASAQERLLPVELAHRPDVPGTRPPVNMVLSMPSSSSVAGMGGRMPTPPHAAAGSRPETSAYSPNRSIRLRWC